MQTDTEYCVEQEFFCLKKDDTPLHDALWSGTYGANNQRFKEYRLRGLTQSILLIMLTVSGLSAMNFAFLE